MQSILHLEQFKSSASLQSKVNESKKLPMKTNADEYFQHILLLLPQLEDLQNVKLIKANKHKIWHIKH